MSPGSDGGTDGGGTVGVGVGRQGGHAGGLVVSGAGAGGVDEGSSDGSEVPGSLGAGDSGSDGAGELGPVGCDGSGPLGGADCRGFDGCGPEGEESSGSFSRSDPSGGCDEAGRVFSGRVGFTTSAFDHGPAVSFRVARTWITCIAMSSLNQRTDATTLLVSRTSNPFSRTSYVTSLPDRTASQEICAQLPVIRPARSPVTVLGDPAPGLAWLVDFGIGVASGAESAPRSDSLSVFRLVRSSALSPSSCEYPPGSAVTTRR